MTMIPVPPPTGSLIGLELKLDRPIDRRNPCCRSICIIDPGKGPHAYGLRCTGCGQHRGWLSKPTAAWIEQVVVHFGVPTSPIVVREATRFEEKEEALHPCAAPAPSAPTQQQKYTCTANEIVPQGLRTYLGWDARHDRAADGIMREFGLVLSRDRELVRQLAFTRVRVGKLRFSAVDGADGGKIPRAE
jgi:hypothetical protein